MAKTTTNNRTFRTDDAPPSAFLMPVNGLFALGDREDKLTPFSLLARSNEPVMHWYWGAIYHDFDGMIVGDSIPIDYCHWPDEILGSGNKFSVKGDGLHIAGNLVHFREGDRVDEITTKRRAGVPYQASIDFRGDNVLFEEVPEGRVAQVNGQQVAGPALILREWPLRGCAICPHGMDQNTTSQFSQDGKPMPVRIFSEAPMTKATLSGKPASKTPTQKSDTTVTQQQSEASDAGSGGTAGGDAASGGDTTEPPSQQSAPAGDAGNGDGDVERQWKAELAKYVTKFGAENGTKWYTEGKTYSESLELHVDALHRQLAAKDDQIKQLNEKLKSLHHGEEVPASMSTDPAEETPDGTGGAQANRFAHMGKAGVFASSIKIPGR